MNDLGLADVILKIQIKGNDQGYILTQTHYIEKILRRFNQFNYISLVTHFDANCRLKKNTREVISQLEYSQII